MNIVAQTLREHIADQNVRFVFPSGTAARLWAQKTCTLGIARSVAANRFLAWDSFKEEVTQERDAKRRPATTVMRKLFAEAMARKNAEAAGGLKKDGGFPLKSVIPVEYAQEGDIFAPFIARILPSLAYWEKMRNNAAKDDEDLDYSLIKNEYSDFLERYHLFEPSWEEIAIPSNGMRYVLFFPELVEDFAEYDALLKAPQFIRVSAKSAPTPKPLVFYRSAREEILSAVMELQKLHEKDGIPYEDMAVSVPELEEMEPCLIRELSIRHIPFVRRAGKKLGQTGAGRLFSLVNECASSRFSFNSLKALILNDHIPWKEREKNKALVSFGIEYNCVSGYEEDGEVIDIWEEAFKEAHASRARDLRSYYRELKKFILTLAGSGNFADIRKYYFTFRGTLLDMEEISVEDDAVLSRCVEELSALIELEKELSYPCDSSDIIPASPLGFFISHLDEIMYVRNESEAGINIYPWRVAAASPFNCHFVLNASQSAAAVLYQPLRFLRHDKRKILGLEDSDATWAFFLLCDSGEENNFKIRTRISASAQTFSGWAIPHSFFAKDQKSFTTEDTEDCCPSDSLEEHGVMRETVNTSQYPDDPYKEERNFWRNLQEAGGAVKLGKIFPLQKKSFDLWKNNLAENENGFSFFNSPFPGDAAENGADLVRKLLEDAIYGDGYIAVTPTKDLNVYCQCPMKWLYSRVFGAEEYSLEAALLDDISLGLLYHKVMEALFARIKQEDTSFVSKRLDTYKRWAMEITMAAIKKEPAFTGPLAIPLVSPQAAGMAMKIAGILDLEAKFFDGYTVGEIEFPVNLKTEGLSVRGTIDRISISPDGDPVIIDYKTSYLTKQTAMEDLDEVSLSEFQMPLYVKLYEDHGNDAVKVRGAYFYSINERKIMAAMGHSTGGRAKVPDREEYEPVLEAAQKQIEEFGKNVKALNFVPHEIRVKECNKCKYRTVCRSLYF